MTRKVLIAGVAGALLIGVGAGAYFYGDFIGSSADAAETAQTSGPPPAIVRVAAAEERVLAPHVETPGSVVSTRDSLVAAATSGKIEWVAEIGAEVAPGEVIARIEQDDARFALDNGAAEVRRLRARADYLDRLVTRYEGLGEEAGESEASLDEMRANRDEARQALTQAEVALARAEVTLERTLVRAPFAGRVVNQEIQVGEFANPGTALVRLVDIQELEVTARAPATLVGNVAAGDAVTIRYGAESADAELRAVVPVGDERSRMLELRFALPQSNWFIGSAVRVALPAAAAKSVIAAPRDALVLRAERISVFVIGDDDTARQVDVELGVAQGEFIEVIGDIKAGDRLVIRGGERLRNGQTVRLDEAPGEPSA